MGKLKWLYPGMKVKRWLILMSIGIMFFSWGLALALNLSVLDTLKISAIKTFYLATGKYITTGVSGILIMSFGIILIIIGVRQLNRSLLSVIVPQGEESLVDLVFHRRQLEKGIKIVAIGGGTGLSTLLRGLKKYTGNITATVTVADDGGSSGRLRNELGVLPPGDVRNCLVALADAEPLMTELFQYRFKNGSLQGQNFGNLLIAAMNEVAGDFSEAIRKASSVLAVRGQVLPSTQQLVVLGAELEDGSIIEGESNISKSKLPIKKVFLKPDNCQPSPEILDALESADMIVIGPGSLYTSILPNLLLEGVVEKLEKVRALKVYICNVMTQPGETDGYKASDHVKVILNHTGRKIFDYVLVNDAQPEDALLRKYQEKGQTPVFPDKEELNKLEFRVISGNFLNQTDLVRHDPDKLARWLMKLAIKVLSRWK